MVVFYMSTHGGAVCECLDGLLRFLRNAYKEEVLEAFSSCRDVALQRRVIDPILQVFLTKFVSYRCSAPSRVPQESCMTWLPRLLDSI